MKNSGFINQDSAKSSITLTALLLRFRKCDGFLDAFRPFFSFCDHFVRNSKKKKGKFSGNFQQKMRISDNNFKKWKILIEKSW